jgi:protein-L-isoaspartate(D-aspartate) O-methyltransferase
MLGARKRAFATGHVAAPLMRRLAFPPALGKNRSRSGPGPSEDSMIDYARARRTMVDTQIRTGDVTDQLLLEAFFAVPRELFMPEAQRSLAYRDRTVQIGGGREGAKRFMLDPLVLAKLLQLGDLDPGDSVLDVACGTGYGAALIARLAASVVALDSDAQLADRARAILGETGVSNAEIVTGGLKAGHAARAPYDVIVIEGAVEEVPQSLQAQLRDGGRLVAIVGSGMAAKAMLYRRSGEEVSGWPAFDAPAPVLAEFAKPPAFVF